MRGDNLFSGMAMVAMLIVTASCGGQQVETVGSYDQMLVALRGKGLEVEPAGTLSQPFFEPEAQLISLDGDQVQVFEFSTEGEAESAAETISPDGSSIGTSMVSWVSTPHFYRAGRLVVLYVGDKGSVVAALEDALGAQIAGR